MAEILILEGKTPRFGKGLNPALPAAKVFGQKRKVNTKTDSEATPISLHAHMKPILEGADSSVNNSQFLLEQLAKNTTLAGFNETVKSWGLAPIQDTKTNLALLKTLETEFPLFKTNLEAFDGSIRIMKFLINGFAKPETDLVKEAEALNKHFAASEYDPNVVATVVKEISTKWQACDFSDKEQAKQADAYADAHSELDTAWPFRFKNLKTLTVLKKLNSETAKTFATLYEAGGPSKVIFLLNILYFSAFTLLTSTTGYGDFVGTIRKGYPAIFASKAENTKCEDAKSPCKQTCCKTGANLLQSSTEIAIG